jgi:competence protein ComEC
MKRSEKFIYFLVVFCFGVLFAIFLERKAFILIFYLFCFFGFYFFVFIKRISFSNFLILLMAFLCGIFRLYIDISSEGEKEFSKENYFISGKVCSEPDFREDKIKYVVCDVEVENPDFSRKLEAKLLVNAPIFPEYSYGEKISFEGVVEKPFSAYEFSYEDYLYRFDVFYFVNRPKNFRLISEVSSLDYLLSKIFSFKKWLLSKISLVYGEPYSSLVSGILLGTRRGFSNEINENFKNAGLMHIVAVSGFNIAILIVFVFLVFSFLRRNVRIILSVFIVVLFVFVSGLSASAIRAGIMGTLSLVALDFGKTYQAKISLFVSGFLMILISPKIIFYDIGFQLSFLATMGLIYLGNPINNLFKFLPEKFEIRSSISLTVSATLCVFPIMVFSFGSLSILSPLSNLLVLPVIPVFMFLSFLSLCFSFFSNFLSLIFAFFAYLISNYVFFVADFFGNIEFSLINLERLPQVFVFLYVCVLVYEMKNASMKTSEGL